MSKLKITPGIVKHDDTDASVFLANPSRNAAYGAVADFFDPEQTGSANENARLYADAHNVANETGKTPRELMEQRDAAVAMLSQLVRHCTESHLCYPNCIDEANAFLASLTSPK